MKTEKSTDAPKRRPAKKMFIARTYLRPVLSVFVIAVAFTAGMYSTQLYGFVAPLFGQKVYTAPVDLSSVESTFRALKAHYDGDVSDSTLIEGANRGMVSALGDKYTVYMNQSEAADFDKDLSGNIGGGIGAELSLRSERVTIIRLLKNNPAEKAGLAVGDTITKVNDESIAGMSLDVAVMKVRGEVGTTVKLTIERNGQTKEFSITRETIISPSAHHEVKDGIGILTIDRFDEDTYSLSREAASAFVSANVRGVVVDLRYNGGGYLDAAKNIAGIWLKNKVVVSERTNGKTVAELKSGFTPILEGVPTAVLVNGSSASASEILAGALQDHKVATIVGEQTFGKGSVQELIQLPNGARLKVTIAKWYTPNGRNITDGGITPDTSVELVQKDLDAGVDPQMNAALDLLKK